MDGKNFSRWTGILFYGIVTGAEPGQAGFPPPPIQN